MTNLFQTKPLYTQVRDAVFERIADGSWPTGSVIPNEIDLAKAYGVSVGTMRKALSTLTDEGFLARRQGRGTFVSDPSSSGAKDRFNRLHMSDGRPTDGDVKQLDCIEQPATRGDVERLEVMAEDDVVVCRQVVQIDAKPTIYREAHFSRKLLPNFDTKHTWDVFAAAKKHGLWVANGVERLSLKKPDRHVAVALGVETSATLLVLDRVLFGFDGKPLEWLVSWCELSAMYYDVSLA